MPQPVVLSGRYVLGSLLGRGGMADVFEAHDSRLGRTVAVKMLRPDMSRDRQLRVRFEREAQAVAALNHPNIVAVYDTGERRADPLNPASVESPFMVMERVIGRTLRELSHDGAITQDKALEYVQGVLAALEYSHRAGIVHRDIKPANVMVTDETGTVKVMDFGIARAIADSGATMTQTQAVVGTAQYLSPEQAQGQTVDARSDLYSTGCLLYELLTGRPPFVGDSAVSVAYQHVQVEAPKARDFNPEVTEAVQSVLDRALQKDPAKRFPDAGAFRRALRAAGAGRVLPAAAQANDDAAATAMALAGAEAGTAEALGTGRHAAAAPPDAVDPHLGDTGEIPPAPPTDAEILLPFGERDERETRRRRHGGWIAVLLIITALVLGGGGYWLYSYLTAPPAVVMVTVPGVTNLKDTDAFAKLSQAGLQPEFTRKPSTDVAKDYAIDTLPAAGTQLAKNSRITIEISSGPSTAVIPQSIIGNTESGARDTLRSLGLVPADQSKSANSPTVPLGHVISVDPGAGQTVAIGTQVTLTISTGKVSVPDLRGRLIDDAKAALTNLGLKVQTKDTPTSSAPAGTVVDQSVAPDGAIDQGGTVVLSVATAPPSPSPSPSPTSGGKKGNETGGGNGVPTLPAFP
ncbi:Stk1 family PASTA domain-containing Ser/Thr kinase [Sinomonas sp. ASV322]|uniref:Stk1 family PASTA domain-containing Ser/Thr kinase n=1 Tax=Sinomonas sp. ASV322 TaxID=3041920 RepID=UPI0027DE6C46|nr:Stk1 family PASTA domain-containing Ser/Thr kinase [Sinomonas sp. ASV322]MDQ4501529.1 Stk1 family PASTA domain-containing Ser/Thr kinase [Sinomonas sp. ASV322]